MTTHPTPPDERATATVRPNAPLTTRQRWTAVGIGAACVVGSGAAAAIAGVLTGTGTGEVAWAAFVYGGLLAAAGVVVYVDRAYSRQCPRCRSRFDRGATRCPDCAYDLGAQPRYACGERHELHLEPGMCRCGRRLLPVGPGRGVHGQVVTTLKLGAGMLAFLVAVWGLLALLP